MLITHSHIFMFVRVQKVKNCQSQILILLAEVCNYYTSGNGSKVYSI